MVVGKSTELIGMAVSERETEKAEGTMRPNAKMLRVW